MRVDNVVNDHRDVNLLWSSKIINNCTLTWFLLRLNELQFSTLIQWVSNWIDEAMQVNPLKLLLVSRWAISDSHLPRDAELLWRSILQDLSCRNISFNNSTTCTSRSFACLLARLLVNLRGVKTIYYFFTNREEKVIMKILIMCQKYLFYIALLKLYNYENAL